MGAREEVGGVGAAVAGLPAARVLRLLRLVFGRMRGHFRELERRTGIGGVQVWALSVIGAQPGIGIGALARALDVHQSTASNLVRTLADGGLVSAEKTGADRRMVQLRLLAAGRSVLERAGGPIAGMLPAALTRLDGDTVERLERDLLAVLELLDAEAATQRAGRAG